MKSIGVPNKIFVLINSLLFLYFVINRNTRHNMHIYAVYQMQRATLSKRNLTAEQ